MTAHVWENISVCVCVHAHGHILCVYMCVDRDSWALNRSRLLDKSMKQWGGHHLPCYSAERTPIHALGVCVSVNICLLSICQLVFADPAVDHKHKRSDPTPPHQTTSLSDQQSRCFGLQLHPLLPLLSYCYLFICLFNCYDNC